MHIRPKYSVVIPVFNSTETHRLLYDRLKSTFSKVGETWEVVFVDDFSSDPNSWPSVKTLSSEEPNVTAIRLMRNFGRGPAVVCAMANAKGKYIITMDDDLQHRPEDIPKLIDHRKHDVVIGEFRKKQHSLGKRITSEIKSWVDYLALKKPVDVKLTSFILMNRDVANAMLSIRASSPFFAALLFYVTRDVVMVPVHHDKREHGKSAFNVWKRLKQFNLLLINNSTIIPRLLVIVGGCIFLLSLGFTLHLIFMYFSSGRSVAGWSSLMVVVLMLSSTIILSIGILGEYLGRIFANTENRPPYLIREVSGNTTVTQEPVEN